MEEGECKDVVELESWLSERRKRSVCDGLERTCRDFADYAATIFRTRPRGRTNGESLRVSTYMSLSGGHVVNRGHTLDTDCALALGAKAVYGRGRRKIELDVFVVGMVRHL